ncbi:sce7726 family protein [Lachnotalea sp. AF33-28]|uniref:sce7726 family protein n=1 Tax=Lachnotalea sp. AF33-28 TaxID=2292046 RepID=UPI0011C3624C|nr:sce7726 family protein [Lachnotalea sp. AF33-28]
MLDKDMREPLFDYLDEYYGKIRIFEEKITGGSRADVIGIIDGNVLGFEIKSDGDSYTRLKTQTADYDRLCDYNYLVVGKSHRKHAASHVPDHWGLLCIFDEGEGETVECIRTPALNPGASLKKQIELLWRPELSRLQEWNGLPAYKQKSKLFVREMIVEKVPEEVLKRQMTDLLFERDYDLLLKEIEEARSLRRPRRRRRRARIRVRTSR